MTITPDTQERIDQTAIAAARATAQETIKPVMSTLHKLVELIIGFREADISAESARLSTLKGENKSVKNRYTPE